jgi:hypothetical protein
MKAGKSTGPEFCSICNRTKTKAINEQVANKKICDAESCTFKKEIKEAIENKKSFKIGTTKTLKTSFKIKK